MIKLIFNIMYIFYFIYSFRNSAIQANFQKNISLNYIYQQTITLQILIIMKNFHFLSKKVNKYE
jgi:hypothetical protein